MKRTLVFVGLLVLVTACDDKKGTSGTAASASAAPAASSAPAATTAATPSATAVASASAAPASSSDTSMVTGDAKDVVLTVKDPAKEPEKSIKVQAGGSLTLFLPDAQGTVWSLDANDKTLGKAKEEVIPGFAPKTMGHQFKWEGLKAGLKHKLQFVNKKAGEKDKAAKPNATFSLTVET